MHEADQTKEQLIEKLTKAIADQRRMAEALRRSEEQYRSVVDHIGIGVALISRNMEVLTLNNLMKKRFPHILSVYDNGEGLKEVDAELIFRLFQRHTTFRFSISKGL